MYIRTYLYSNALITDYSTQSPFVSIKIEEKSFANKDYITIKRFPKVLLLATEKELEQAYIEYIESKPKKKSSDVYGRSLRELIRRGPYEIPSSTCSCVSEHTSSFGTETEREYNRRMFGEQEDENTIDIEQPVENTESNRDACIAEMPVAHGRYYINREGMVYFEDN